MSHNFEKQKTVRKTHVKTYNYAKYGKTDYVDDDGVLYTKDEIYSYHFKVNDTENIETYDYKSNTHIKKQIKHVTVLGKKAQQLKLF